MNHDVFISHSSRDKEIVLSICDELEKNGIKCWCSSRGDIINSDFYSAIHEAIDACKVYLIIISKESIKSKWVQYGAHLIWEDNKTGHSNKQIVLFRIDDTEWKELPIILRYQRGIDAFPNYKSSIDELVKLIIDLLGINT